MRTNRKKYEKNQYKKAGDMRRNKIIHENKQNEAWEKKRRKVFCYVERK